jgi:3D (Asp-Asp-Asp) domain-containing protein
MFALCGCGSSGGSPASTGDLDANGADDTSSTMMQGAGDGGSDAPVAPDGPDLSMTSEASPLGDAGGDAGSSGDGTTEGGAPGEGGLEAGTMMSVYVTFYGWADNSPPGGAIAYPKNGGFPTIHDTAGGTGTYADPITFATDKDEIPVGTRLYVPFIEKYMIMEDDCVECDSDWTSSHKWHTDLWMNSNASESSSALISCEDAWTRTSAVIEINPPTGRTVTTAPLFDPASNVCRTTP